LGRVEFPSAPVSVIVEIILSGAGLKDTVTGYGPGKFVFEGAHLNTVLKLKITDEGDLC
jgi:hypothetical protein